MPALLGLNNVGENMDESEDGSDIENIDGGGNKVDDVIKQNYTASANAYLPLVAVPEKIVLCVDVSQDSTFTSYTLSDNTTCNPILPLKKCLKNFVYNKHSFSNKHQFALMSLEPGTVKWLKDFTNNPEEVAVAVDDLEVICQSEELEVDITPIFKILNEHIGSIPNVKVKDVQFPTHIIRLILVYNSSYNVPKLTRLDEPFKLLTSSNYFKWDVLYLHDAPTDENKCQEIYDNLLRMVQPDSYVFETSRKIVKLYNTMAKFLSHPLQRFELPY